MTPETMAEAQEGRLLHIWTIMDRVEQPGRLVDLYIPP
mgnify:CR=1 FL=1